MHDGDLQSDHHEEPDDRYPVSSAPVIKRDRPMKILAFGAHPDDLEIGMGGTIARHISRGHEVLMVVATVPNRKEIRIPEAEQAAAILGAELIVMDVPPDELVFSREMVRQFDHIFKEYRPDTVYTHSNNDSHQDHNAVTNAVIATTRKNDCSLYMYEQTIPGGIAPLPFRSQYFIDISETIDQKLESIMAHKSQLDTYGPWWLEGIKGRASYHGFQVNTKYAEVFEVVKHLADW
jgi:LmbE family N-acetylglucosaminyl deacetylase